MTCILVGTRKGLIVVDNQRISTQLHPFVGVLFRKGLIVVDNQRITSHHFEGEPVSQVLIAVVQAGL